MDRPKIRPQSVVTRPADGPRVRIADIRKDAHKSTSSAVESTDLRSAGLKVTLPRLKILEILENSATRHLSAEDVYKVLINHEEDIGLATVYRVLTQFEQAGLVKRHHFEDGHAVFELDRGEHHDHMVDIESGKVIEFVSEEIEELQHQVAHTLGFDIIGHSLVLYVRPKGGKSSKG